ncbi:MAG: PQQ-dependent sugar dehydrogenase [Gammaproteobacteria bacterium]|nr:PQQ-dependent sugar dehydrogenase [Gammaproteobacteria bacterium]
MIRILEKAVMAVCAALSFTACSEGAAPVTQLTLPPGFKAEVYVENVPGARSMVMGARGTLFVSTKGEGKVYAVQGIGSDHRNVKIIADKLNLPNGVAFKDGQLYVAEVSRILRYTQIESHLDAPPEPEVIVDDLPSDRHHGWRYIAFGPDGKLYVPIGAPCNICDQEGYAVITRMSADGGDREVIARGVRNTVGFTWHPQSGDLWFTDNGRDWLGDDTPPCELNHLTEPGMHFGFPYCHGNDISDPDFGDGHDCSSYTPPAQVLGPHVAPLGVKFYTGTMFPEQYRMQAFIAEHGSWNRSEKTGYRVSLVRMVEGTPVAYEPFAEGWLDGDSVSGRPVDILVMDDGSMLVSDDQAGKIWRISYIPR